jgi:hypothetical protein
VPTTAKLIQMLVIKTATEEVEKCKVKLKVKAILEQVTKAQRGSRGIALPFL